MAFAKTEMMQVLSSMFDNPGYQAAKQMLDVTTVKHQAFAANIANASTPGYKRVQLSKSFEQELQSCIKNGKSLNLTGLSSSIERDSTATSSRLDGNNVQVDQELLEMSGNATNYQVITQFLNGSFRQMRSAITGKSA